MPTNRIAILGVWSREGDRLCGRPQSWEAVRVSGYCWAKGFAGNFRFSDSFLRRPFVVALRLCLDFICGTLVPYAHPKVILLSLALRLPDDVTTALTPTIGPKKSIAILGPALQGQLQLGHIVTRLIIVFFSVWSILLSVHPSLHLGVF